MDLTESVLKKCETRGKLNDKLTKFYDYPKYGAPFREADKYWTSNTESPLHAGMIFR